MTYINNDLKAKAVKARVPLMMALEISPICNFQCRMRYVRQDADSVAHLGGLHDADWWLNVAEQARDLGLLFPLITGGEPFLYPEIEKLYSGIA